MDHLQGGEGRQRVSRETARTAQEGDWKKTRLDFVNRPQATHRYDHRGGHRPTPPHPKQATAFTTSHAHIIASIASAAKAWHACWMVGHRHHA
eukprot:6790649-Prymnesium_polylepis.1